MGLHWQKWVTEGGPLKVLPIPGFGSFPLLLGQPWCEYLLPQALPTRDGDTSTAVSSIMHIY